MFLVFVYIRSQAMPFDVDAAHFSFWLLCVINRSTSIYYCTTWPMSFVCRFVGITSFLVHFNRLFFFSSLYSAFLYLIQWNWISWNVRGGAPWNGGNQILWYSNFFGTCDRGGTERRSDGSRIASITEIIVYFVLYLLWDCIAIEIKSLMRCFGAMRGFISALTITNTEDKTSLMCDSIAE